MRVRYRNPPRDSYPADEAPFAKQNFLTATNEYEVHAISVFEGVTFLLVVDDLNTPIFRPRVLFDVVSPQVPADWICNLFPDGPVQLVMGPTFIAKDRASYGDMVDQRKLQVDALFDRIEAARLAEETDDE